MLPGSHQHRCRGQACRTEALDQKSAVGLRKGTGLFLGGWGGGVDQWPTCP